jgi:hypothetical protein
VADYCVLSFLSPSGLAFILWATTAAPQRRALARRTGARHCPTAGARLRFDWSEPLRVISHEAGSSVVPTHNHEHGGSHTRVSVNPRLWAPFVVVGEPAKPN